MAEPFDPWRNYRQRRRLLLGSSLVGLAVFLGSLPLARSRHSVQPFYIGLAVCVALIAWGTAPLADFPCPRCGEPFAHRGRQRNLFTRRCLHCRLDKWSDPT